MMNLESFQYSSFTFEDLHNAIADRMQQDDHYYLLLDEVQLVDKWERAVNALHTDADVDITSLDRTPTCFPASWQRCRPGRRS